MPQPVLTPFISSLRDLVGSFTESGSNSVNNVVSDSLLSLEQVHAAKDPNNKINLNMIHGCGARLWNAASGLVAADPEEVSKLMSLSLELLCFRLSFADTDEEKLLELVECSGRVAQLVRHGSSEKHESFGFRACDALRTKSTLGSTASSRMAASVSAARWNQMEQAVAAGDETKVTRCLEECLEHTQSAVSHGIDDEESRDSSVILKKLATQSKERAIEMLNRSNYRAAGSFMRENLRLSAALDDRSGSSSALVFLARIHVASGDWKQAEQVIEEANQTAVSNEGLFTALQIQANLSNDSEFEGGGGSPLALAQVREAFLALTQNDAPLEMVLAAVDLVAQFHTAMAQQLFTALMQESRFQTKGMNQIRLRYLRFCLRPTDDGGEQSENAIRLCQAMLEDHRSGHVFLSAEQARTAFSCIFFTSHEAMRNKD